MREFSTTKPALQQMLKDLLWTGNTERLYKREELPFLSAEVNEVKWKSCPIFCDPMDHGIPQARILEWVAIPLSRGSSQPRDWTQASRHCRRILYQLSCQGSPWRAEVLGKWYWKLWLAVECLFPLLGNGFFKVLLLSPFPVLFVRVCFQQWSYSLHVHTQFSSVQFSHSVVSNSLRPHEPQHARLPCPSPTPRVYPNSCPLSRWCHPTISSSVIPFSSHLQSFPASGSFPMSQFFTSGGQIGASAIASVLPMNIQDWFPLGWIDLISLQSKGLSRVFSNTTVQKHQFFCTQLSSQSNSHIHTWLLENP